MARNPVQFQKGISLSVFLSLYGTEDRNGPRELESAVSGIFLGFQAAKSR